LNTLPNSSILVAFAILIVVELDIERGSVNVFWCKCEVESCIRKQSKQDTGVSLPIGQSTSWRVMEGLRHSKATE
jgi:hypothetical protein